MIIENDRLPQGLIKDITLFHLGRPIYVWLRYNFEEYRTELRHSYMIGFSESRNTNPPGYRGNNFKEGPDQIDPEEIGRILKSSFIEPDKRYQPARYNWGGIECGLKKISIKPGIISVCKREIECRNILIEERRELAKRITELYSEKSLVDIYGWNRGLDPIVKPLEKENDCL